MDEAIKIYDKEESARSLIKILNNRSKFKIKEVSKKLGYSRQSFQNRINVLIERKIITKFTINIHPNLNPKNFKYVIIEIKTNPKEPYLVDELLKIEELKVLDGILGEFSLFALFIFDSAESYFKIINKIDNIMAKSYFKKYHIIETIKVFKINGIELDSIKLNSNFELNKVDYLILKILQKRQGLKPISTYEVKNILNKDFKDEINVQYKDGISQPTIYNRIKHLEKEGVILNYTINFNPKKLGYKGKYLVRIKPKDPSRYNKIALNLERNQFITDLFRIGEQYGLFAIIRVRNVEDYANFIKYLYDTEEIEDTFTNFVLDELIPYTNFLIY
ncbi:MAG: Lrp/AsnC ligand binding domain-containing protein [Promethearchaeota archaeon]